MEVETEGRHFDRGARSNQVTRILNSVAGALLIGLWDRHRCACARGGISGKPCLKISSGSGIGPRGNRLFDLRDLLGVGEQGSSLFPTRFEKINLATGSKLVN